MGELDSKRTAVCDESVEQTSPVTRAGLVASGAYIGPGSMGRPSQAQLREGSEVHS